MRHPILFIPVALLIGFKSFAQVSLIPSPVTEFRVTPGDLLSGSILSALGEERVYLICEVTEATTGEDLLSIQTPHRTLLRGSNLMGELLPEARVNYSNLPIAQMLRVQQRLPIGSFRICWTLFSSDGAELLDSECQDIDSETYTILDLVYPADRDTIETTRPTLTWVKSGEFATQREKQFRLTLVEVPIGGSPESSIREERALFVIAPLNQLSVSYPAHEQPLTPGRWYAWIVEWLDGGRPVVATDTWSFFVGESHPVPEIKFVRLRKGEVLPMYTAVNKFVHFAVEDGYYTAEQLNLRLYTLSGERLMPMGADGSLPLESKGQNLFTLDLKPYGLSRGNYVMVVLNARGDKYSLNIEVK